MGGDPRSGALSSSTLSIDRGFVRQLVRNAQWHKARKRQLPPQLTGRTGTMPSGGELVKTKVPSHPLRRGRWRLRLSPDSLAPKSILCPIWDGDRSIPTPRLTLPIRRVINACFAQGVLDQDRTCPVHFFGPNPARTPTRPSFIILQVLRWKRVRISGNQI